MNCGSFFSGTGGFDLPSDWMGWNNIFNCEIDPFCRKILKYYWPNAIQHEDIRNTDFTIYRGTIDLVSGGFPCQPYSVAGKRLGKEDARHLWPEMRRGIREIQPRWVVGENVRGLVSWNGGLVFEEVCADLEAEGYEVQPFILPACGVGAPHRRDRVWFVAFNASRKSSGRNHTSKGEGISSPNYASSDCKSQFRTPMQFLQSQEPIRKEFSNSGKSKYASNSNSSGFQEFDTSDLAARSEAWKGFPTQPPICGRNDGLPRNLDGIAFSKWRNESIKSFGNAVVPQVVLQIYKAIEQYETREWFKN